MYYEGKASRETLAANEPLPPDTFLNQEYETKMLTKRLGGGCLASAGFCVAEARAAERCSERGGLVPNTSC